MGCAWGLDWTGGRKSGVGLEDRVLGDGTRKGVLARRLQFWLGMNGVQTLESNWGANWGNDGIPVRLMAEAGGAGQAEDRQEAEFGETWGSALQETRVPVGFL